MDCDTIQELLEAYALGALEPDEAHTVEQHLAQCPQCRQIAHAYADVVATLPEALALVSPARLPGAVKVHLLQTLDRSTTTGTDDPLNTAETTARSAPASNSHHRRSPRQFLFWWLQPGQHQRLALIAAAVLLILSLAWSIRLNAVLARERALRAEFAELVDRQEVVLEVIDSNQTERRILRSPDPDSRAYGKLFTRSDLPHVVAMAARLAPPPPGQAYFLWVTSEGQTSLAGALNVNDEGFGLIVFDADHNGPIYESAQVTLQATDTNTPAAPPVLVWQAES